MIHAKQRDTMVPMVGRYNQQSECDVSVSKLLGFETFPLFLMVSNSVSKKIGIEKSIGFGIVKFGIGKSFGFGFVQFLGIVKQ